MLLLVKVPSDTAYPGFSLAEIEMSPLLAAVVPACLAWWMLIMKAELVNTTLDFSGHKKVTADIDISRLDLREHYISHGFLTVKSSSSHRKIGTDQGKKNVLTI